MQYEFVWSLTNTEDNERDEAIIDEHLAALLHDIHNVRVVDVERAFVAQLVEAFIDGQLDELALDELDLARAAALDETGADLGSLGVERYGDRSIERRALETRDCVTDTLDRASVVLFQIWKR